MYVFENGKLVFKPNQPNGVVINAEKGKVEKTYQSDNTNGDNTDNDVMTFGTGDLDSGSQVVNTWDKDAGNIVQKNPDGSMAVGNASQGLNEKTEGGLGGALYRLPDEKVPVAEQPQGGGDIEPAQGTGAQNGTLSKDMSDEEYLKALMPMSKEEEEKRLRGAKAAQGIAHLGNVLASLGNVIFTGKGAPSQKMGEVQNPDYDKLLERNRQQNQQYMAAMNSRERLAMQERKMEAQEMFQSKKLELDAQKQELYKAKLDLQMKMAEQKSENDKALTQAKLDKIDEEIRKLQNDEQIARERADAYAQGQMSLAQYRQGMLSVARQNANSNAIRAKKYQSDSDDTDVLDLSDDEDDGKLHL